MALATDRLTLSPSLPVGLIAHRTDVALAIPHAKSILWKGEPALAIPHRPDEARVLTNLGIDVESPIMRRYDWAGGSPFESQKLTAAMLTTEKRAFVLSEMGVGKSRAALFAFDYLKKTGQAETMLIVSPLSTLRAAWLREIQTCMPHLTACVVHGSAAIRNGLLESGEFDIFIINHDGVRHSMTQLASRQFDVICIDELSGFKSANAKRSRAMQRIAAAAPYVWGMTGTPTPNGPEDAHGQVRVVRPDQVPFSAAKWKDMTMQKVSTFRWVPRHNSTEMVQKAMSPAVRFKRSDVFELPPMQFVRRDAPMSLKQEKVYKTIVKNLLVTLQSGATISVANAGVLFMKTLQVACLAADTEVLTERGWKPLWQVQPTERVWDGVAWVEHKGLVYRGERATINLSGIYMTPDHMVLTAGGWQRADASEGLDRKAVRIPDGTPLRGERQKRSFALAVFMRLWARGNSRSGLLTGCMSHTPTLLRMFPRQHAARSHRDACMEQLVSGQRAMPQSELERLRALWRQRHNHVRTLAQFVQGFLGGYGAYAWQGAYVGQSGWHEGILAGELPMGVDAGAAEQPQQQSVVGDPGRHNDLGERGPAIWSEDGNALRASAQEPVYDLLDCGPRSRFTVRPAGGGEALIVHNCGFVYDNNGLHHLVDPVSRMDAVADAIEEWDKRTKFLVFNPFRMGVNMLHEHLTKRGMNVECIDGSTSEKKRSEIFDRFRDDPTLEGIVAHPRCMSHGLTLVEANLIVWSAPYPSLEVYEQANARISRPGQTSSQLVVQVSGSKVEDAIYSRLQQRGNLQRDLLRIVEEGMSTY